MSFSKSVQTPSSSCRMTRSDHGFKVKKKSSMAKADSNFKRAEDIVSVNESTPLLVLSCQIGDLIEVRGLIPVELKHISSVIVPKVIKNHIGTSLEQVPVFSAPFPSSIPVICAPPLVIHVIRTSQQLRQTPASLHDKLVLACPPGSLVDVDGCILVKAKYVAAICMPEVSVIQVDTSGEDTRLDLKCVSSLLLPSWNFLLDEPALCLHTIEIEGLLRCILPSIESPPDCSTRSQIVEGSSNHSITHSPAKQRKCRDAVHGESEPFTTSAHLQESAVLVEDSMKENTAQPNLSLLDTESVHEMNLPGKTCRPTSVEGSPSCYIVSSPTPSERSSHSVWKNAEVIPASTCSSEKIASVEESVAADASEQDSSLIYQEKDHNMDLQSTFGEEDCIEKSSSCHKVSSQTSYEKNNRPVEEQTNESEECADRSEHAISTDESQPTDTVARRSPETPRQDDSGMILKSRPRKRKNVEQPSDCTIASSPAKKCVYFLRKKRRPALVSVDSIWNTGKVGAAKGASLAQHNSSLPPEDNGQGKKPVSGSRKKKSEPKAKNTISEHKKKSSCRRESSKGGTKKRRRRRRCKCTLCCQSSSDETCSPNNVQVFNRFRCPKCDMVFGTRLLRRTHMSVHHKGEAVVVCTFCEYGFKGQRALFCHLSTHATADKSLYCEHCYVLFRNKENYDVHMRLQHEPVCKICDERIPDKDYLAHVKICTTNAYGEYSYELILEGAFNCSQCTQAFISLSALQAHQLLTHCQRKDPITCPDCGEEFTLFSSLRRHRDLIHKKIKKYVCKTCGRKFGQISNLKSHEKLRHSDRQQKTFLCHLCWKAFRNKASLVKHTGTAHMHNRKRLCPHCGKWRTNVTVYDRQLRLGDAEIPKQPCPHCGKMYPSIPPNLQGESSSASVNDIDMLAYAGKKMEEKACQTLM